MVDARQANKGGLQVGTVSEEYPGGGPVQVLRPGFVGIKKTAAEACAEGPPKAGQLSCWLCMAYSKGERLVLRGLDR